jgi:predicted branched-subunit amino acid permease
MSLLVFTGASQFAAVGIVSTGNEPLSALGAVLLLAAPKGVYSLSMADTPPTNRVKRLIAAQQ